MPTRAPGPATTPPASAAADAASGSAADAERLFEAGRLEDALAAFEALAAREPEALRPRSRVAACLLALGRHAAAASLLEPLAEAMPEQPLVLYRLADARAGLADLDGAFDALERAASAGLRQAAGIDDDATLERVRADGRYAAIRARIARNDAPTADDPRFRAFDFWVGTWEARTPDGMLQGRNRIERVLGGAAIVERWTGASGYRGTSLNRYDRGTDTWRQTWVDDQGDIVEFVDGVAADGRVVFGAVDADGGRRRLTFEDRGADAFRQLSERSTDDGRSWTVEYDFAYRRLAGESAEDPGPPTNGDREPAA